jgi:hypothetical protein
VSKSRELRNFGLKSDLQASKRGLEKTWKLFEYELYPEMSVRERMGSKEKTRESQLFVKGTKEREEQVHE